MKNKKAESIGTTLTNIPVILILLFIGILHISSAILIPVFNGKNTEIIPRNFQENSLLLKKVNIAGEEMLILDAIVLETQNTQQKPLLKEAIKILEKKSGNCYFLKYTAYSQEESIAKQAEYKSKEIIEEQITNKLSKQNINTEKELIETESYYGKCNE